MLVGQVDHTPPKVTLRILHSANNGHPKHMSVICRVRKRSERCQVENGLNQRLSPRSMQLREAPGARDQVSGSTIFDDATGFHHKHAVGDRDGR